MTLTRVFQYGNSQAVRISKEFRYNTDRVIVTRVGHALVLTPEDQLAAVMREGFRSVPEDFLHQDGKNSFLLRKIRWIPIMNKLCRMKGIAVS